MHLYGIRMRSVCCHRNLIEMTEQIQRLVEQVYKERKEKRKSELAALQAQINPHFLYNTLSSVSSLIKMNCPDEAFTMIHAIGMFLPHSFK